jgi:thymidylate kinase
VSILWESDAESVDDLSWSWREDLLAWILHRRCYEISCDAYQDARRGRTEDLETAVRMIIAIEGLSGVGKTTVWNLLRTYDGHFDRRLIFPNFLSVNEKLFPYIEEVMSRDIALFSSMYNEGTVYVTDRFFSVSPLVYGKVLRRPVSTEVIEFIRKTKVIYLYADLSVIKTRIGKRKKTEVIDDVYLEDIENSYESLMESGLYWDVRSIDTTKMEEQDVFEEVCQCIQNFLS